MDLKHKLPWKAIQWKRAQKVVTKLQQKIFQASLEQNNHKLQLYQNKLLNSDSAKRLAVRKVTQDNRGKKTAGVDGIRHLQPEERLELVQRLRLNNCADPIRRVYIPKPGTDEKRPLGIPTIRDRAKQALAKMALEPEWEARFEPNSYGFRPGRSTRDAVEAIHHTLRGTKTGKFVLDADISKCFDRIDHDKLLNKLDTLPQIRNQVRAWLKAGVIDAGASYPTLAGTPQGGVISPLLSNIALHGMENHLKQWVGTQIVLSQKGVKLSPTAKRASLTVVRYADDFVIMHKDLCIVENAKREIELWLADIGLEIKESKTRIVHTDVRLNGSVGFDFLGFNIRRYPVGANSRNRFGASQKTIIKPSKQGTKNHYRELKEIARNTNKTVVLVTKFNPIIRGWCNYFSTVSSKSTFSKLRGLLFYLLWRWIKKKHPTRPASWRYSNYFGKSGSQLLFGLKTPEHTWAGIKYHNAYRITRHVKVKGGKWTYDGDHRYWTLRLSKYSGVSGQVQKLLLKQTGNCALCLLPFWPGSVMEVDHLIPKSKGGTDRITNLRLVHGHCHDQRDLLENVEGSSNKS